MPPVHRQEEYNTGGVVDWKTFTLSKVESLREFVENQIALEKQTVHTRFRLNYRALKVQIKELDRRLDHLNGAQAKAEQDRVQFVQKDSIEPRLQGAEARINKLELGAALMINRETFDDYKKSQESAKELLANALAEMKGRMLAQAATVALVVTLVSGIAVGLVIKWLSK